MFDIEPKPSSRDIQTNTNQNKFINEKNRNFFSLKKNEIKFPKFS